MKHRITYLSGWFLLLSAIMAAASCANIIPPGGGPKDSLPPRLVFSSPKDSSVNVKPKSIVLTFDEYITPITNVSDIIVSPTQKKMPSIDSKLRNITIRFFDSLESNTTYTINFGNNVTDVNEGNVAKNFSYVFSTGNTLDKNIYKGKVYLAETGQTDSTLIVMLYRNLDDTAVIKQEPRYFTRVNSNGSFIFRNLPSGTFAVYAMGKSFLKKYDDSTRMFAFRGTPVIIGSNTKPDTLYAYEEVKRKERTGSTGTKVNAGKNEDKRLKYNTSLEFSTQDLLSGLTLTFNRKLASIDASKITLTDTNYNKLNGYALLLDTNRTKLTIHNNWKENTSLRLILMKESVTDSAGTNLPKSDTIRFTTRKETEYGSLRIRFKGLDLSRNPVLQFIQNKAVVESFVLTGPELNRKLYKPGAYEMRILYDSNRNGIWDPGKFIPEKRQPEIVRLLPNQLSIRGNWDNQFDISL